MIKPLKVFVMRLLVKLWYVFLVELQLKITVLSLEELLVIFAKKLLFRKITGGINRENTSDVSVGITDGISMGNCGRIP